MQKAKKNCTFFYVLCIFTIGLISCRFGKPLICFDKSIQEEAIDSLKLKEKEYYWTYLSLEHGVHKGSFIVNRFYDSKNRLVEKRMYKHTRESMWDGPTRSYEEYVYYDTTGRRIHKNYYISKNPGIGGYCVVKDTMRHFVYEKDTSNRK